MEKMLTREEILLTNLSELYLSFLLSFTKEYSEALQKQINQTVINKRKKFDLKVKIDFGNMTEGTIDSADRLDEIYFSIGEMKHELEISFALLDTRVLCLLFRMDKKDYTSLGMEIAEIFSEEMLEICADWLLSCTLPDKFIKRLKK